MSRPIRLAVVGLAALAVLAGAPPRPALAERTQSDLVLIREDDVVTEDLYAAGDIVLIQGVIEGDLVAAAFTEVRIEGEVQGSVLALTSNLVVDGIVGGSVRAVAPNVSIGGTIGEDVFVGAWSAETGPQADIGRDLLAWANTVDAFGSIGRNLEGQFRAGLVGASVGGNVDITVGRLTVGPSADITGDLVYVGGADATISDGAEVGGSVLAEDALPPNVRIRAMFILVRTLLAIAVLGLGLGIVWAAPDRSRNAARNVSRRPLVAFAWGVGLASIPVAMALIVGVFVALSPPATGLPLLAIFGPIVLAAFGILLVALLAAPVPVAAAIGARLDRGWSVYAWFAIGAILLIALSVVPVIGGPAVLIAALTGLGGWMMADESAGVGVGAGADQ